MVCFNLEMQAKYESREFITIYINHTKLYPSTGPAPSLRYIWTLKWDHTADVCVFVLLATTLSQRRESQNLLGIVFGSQTDFGLRAKGGGVYGDEMHARFVKIVPGIRSAGPKIGPDRITYDTGNCNN